MTQNKDGKIEHSKTNELNKKSPFNENTILTIIVFILIINELTKKNPFSSGHKTWPEDDYIVTMGQHPAFPLEKDEENDKKTILNIKSQKDLHSMINNLKPHMSIKNKKIINVYEKYQSLMEGLNNLSSTAESESNIQNLSINEPKNIVTFLYDIKPFIHPEYHYQIQQFSDGVNNILNIQKNILNLQNTFDYIKNINDNTKKVNNLVEALKPFMGEDQKKTIEQLKNVSQVLEMAKIAEGISGNTTKYEDTSIESPEKFNIASEAKDQDNKKAQLLEILDLFDSSPENKVVEEEQNKDHTNQKLDKITEQPEVQEQQYEEIFEENIDFEEQED